MGMCLGLNTLSDNNIEAVLNNPPLIWRVIAPDDPDTYLDEINTRKTGFLSKIFKGGKTTEIPAIDYEKGEGHDEDLDKAWHGIHYLLTQSDYVGEPPLNFIMCGGIPVGDIDVGYGSARVINSKELMEISEALNQIDHNYLKSRFDPNDMMKKGIYPEIWDRKPEEDNTLEYCLEYFDILKQFVNEASVNKLAIALYLC